jgi:ligand-binding sensor domain-containing protein/class 3 adenylate cyclase
MIERNTSKFGLKWPVSITSNTGTPSRTRRWAGRILAVFFLSFIFPSCIHKQQNKPSEIKPIADAVGISPRADTLKPAKITYLDACPKPVTIVIPPGTVDHLVPANKARLSPPEKRTAGFLAHMTTYSSEQGLYGLISEIMCDHNGNMWFGTDGGGVIRYDGRSFTNYTTAQGLGSNTVRSMAESPNGDLWFGTDGGGACRFNGKYFRQFTTKDGLGNDNIWCILVDKKGNTWFGTDGGGASCYDGRTFTSYTTAQGLPDNCVRCMAEDKNGNIWFGTNAGGACMYDGHAFVTFRKEQGLASNTIRSMICDKAGNMWLGTYDKGVSRYDPSAAQRPGSKPFTNYGTEDGLCSNTIFSIAEDNDGEIWFGTNGKGLSCFDPSAAQTAGAKVFTTFSTSEGLCNNTVLSIAKDKTGNLWFGTFGGGASLYDGKAFTCYGAAQGLSNNQVLSITEDKNGAMWFGTAVGGVSRFDLSAPLRAGLPSFTTYSTGQGLPGTQVVSLAEDKNGDLWIGTFGGGVSRYDSKTLTTFTTAQGLGMNTVMTVFPCKNGDIWIGTDGGGVSRFDGKSFTTYTTAQGLCNNSVLSIAEDNSGGLWFGTNGGGVSCWNGNVFKTFGTAQGLCNNKVYCITTDNNGSLWMGTDGGGVSRYDGKSFITYSTAEGLCNNVVFAITADTSGKIWFGTNEGLCGLTGYVQQQPNARNESDKENTPIIPVNKLSNAELTEKYTPVFKTYSFRKGYPVKDVNENALFADKNGTIWAGTSDKLVRFDPHYLNERSDTPIVFISAIRIDNEPVCWGDLKNSQETANTLSTGDSLASVNEEINVFGDALTPWKRDTMFAKFGDITFGNIQPFYPIPEHLVLPYGHDNVSFDFGAIETARPNMVNYQYMLEGYNKSWYPASNKSSVSFGNIHEGTYTFKLRAQSPDGIWSKPLTYEFTVRPPVYRTWIAYLIYIVLIFLTVLGITRVRTSQLRMDKEKLELVVAERTAQIAKEKAEVEKQKNQSEKLLLNILPEEVAAELKETGTAKAKNFENVTVVFTDFVNFTQTSERMTPQELIDELHYCFKNFDEIITRYNIEKIKTIGDAYLAVSGLPVADGHHYVNAVNAVNAAWEIALFMAKRYDEKGNKTFKIRIGIHTGNVIAGIVGVTKFAYDIWGDTVNTAARMEQSSIDGRINISQTTYNLVNEKFHCTYRGNLEAKNKGKLSMYFVDKKV